MATEKSDIYSLGATMFHLLARRPPPWPLELKDGTETLPALPDVYPGINPGTVAAITAMLQPKPELRPESTRQVRLTLVTCRAEIISEETGVFARFSGDTNRFVRPDAPEVRPLPPSEPMAPPVDRGRLPRLLVGLLAVLLAALLWWLRGPK